VFIDNPLLMPAILCTALVFHLVLKEVGLLLAET